MSYCTYVLMACVQYSFDGYLHMIFANQDFKVSGTPYTISGKTVLVDVFGQKSDVNAWGMFGALIAWVLFFRTVHYLLFLYASAPFLKKDEPPSSLNLPVNGQTSNGKVKSVSPVGAYEMVSQDPSVSAPEEGV